MFDSRQIDFTKNERTQNDHDKRTYKTQHQVHTIEQMLLPEQLASSASSSTVSGINALGTSISCVVAVMVPPCDAVEVDVPLSVAIDDAVVPSAGVRIGVTLSSVAVFFAVDVSSCVGVGVMGIRRTRQHTRQREHKRYKITGWGIGCRNGTRVSHTAGWSTCAASAMEIASLSPCIGVDVPLCISIDGAAFSSVVVPPSSCVGVIE